VHTNVHQTDPQFRRKTRQKPFRGMIHCARRPYLTFFESKKGADHENKRKKAINNSGAATIRSATTAAKMGGGLNSIFTNRKPKKAKTPKGVIPPTKGWLCSKEEQSIGLDETKAMMATMGMHIPNEPKKILGKVGGKHGDMGTDSAKQTTIDRYQTFWKTLRDFCFVLGDYKSAMILCRDDCPSNPFPIALKTAVHCLRFCVMEKGTVLRDMDTNEPVID
jgi:hypothetical protein